MHAFYINCRSIGIPFKKEGEAREFQEPVAVASKDQVQTRLYADLRYREFECTVLVLVEAEKKVGAIALEDQLTYEALSEVV